MRFSAEDLNLLKWYIDVSHQVHPDFRSHTGGLLTLGKGSVYNKSSKQKINTRSSTESELVGVDDVIVQILWTNLFMEEQGYNVNDTIVFQDNKSALLLEKNGRYSSSKRTKHIEAKYFFVQDCYNRKKLRLEFCPTDDMVADFFTKPLQGKKFHHFRKNIMGL